MVPPYAYGSLPTGDSIRLLKIVSTGAEGQPKVSLTTTSLSNSALSFNALLYTWGNPFDKEHPYYTAYNDDKSSVSCEESSIKVTENLMDALRELSQDMQLSDSYIWIDAICINQENVDERTQHIKLMSKIYSETSWVVIWLGRSDPTSDRAIELSEVSGEDHTVTLMGLNPDGWGRFWLEGPSSVTRSLITSDPFLGATSVSLLLGYMSMTCARERVVRRKARCLHLSRLLCTLSPTMRGHISGVLMRC